MEDREMDNEQNTGAGNQLTVSPLLIQDTTGREKSCPMPLVQAQPMVLVLEQSQAVFP
jgi:hypothetical protein